MVWAECGKSLSDGRSEGIVGRHRGESQNDKPAFGGQQKTETSKKAAEEKGCTSLAWGGQTKGHKSGADIRSGGTTVVCELGHRRLHNRTV